MRLRSVVREALLNVRTGVSAAAGFALALAVTAGSLGFADAAAIVGLERAADDYQRSGGSTLVYLAPGRVDGATCDRLADVTGVRAAGALKSAPKREARAMKGSLIPVFTITGGFGGFAALNGVTAQEGAIVSQDVADVLGVGPGGRIPLDTGTVDVGGVYPYPSDGRRPGYGYAVLLPVPSNQLFDECWVEAWPQSDDIERLLSLTVVSDAEPGQAPPTLQQLNSSAGSRFDGADRFEERITRFAPFASAVLAFVLGYLSIRRRRLQLASARHAGVPRSALLLQTTIETVVWMSAGSAAAMVALSVSIGLWATADRTAATLSAWCAVAASGAAVLGSASATLGVREKQLFRYFKQR